MPTIEAARRRDEIARKEPRRNVAIRPAAMRHRRAADRRFIRKVMARQKVAA